MRERPQLNNCGFRGAKLLLVAFVFVLLTACGQKTAPHVQPTDSVIVGETQGEKDLHSMYVHLDPLRSKMPGKLFLYRVWQDRDSTYLTMLSMQRIPEKQFGGIYVSQWKWSGTRPELQWSFRDSQFCDFADIVIANDLDSLVVEDLDGDQKREIVFVYTLNCTNDRSPGKRHLVVLTSAGEEDIVLDGWTRDPASRTTWDEINYEYDPEKREHPEGKIENYKILDKCNEKAKSRLIQIWAEAFVKPVSFY